MSDGDFWLRLVLPIVLTGMCLGWVLFIGLPLVWPHIKSALLWMAS